MKNKILSLAVIILFSNCIFAQQEGRYNVLSHSDHSGTYVKSIADLVSISDVIVKGRYDQVVAQHSFYGYGRTRSDMQEAFGLSDKEVERLALPMTDFEIIIDEVLKGDYKPNETLIHRVLESPENTYKDEIVEARKGNFLLFLARTPDANTYGIHGNMFVMKFEDDRLTYYFEKEKVNALNMDISASEFMNLVAEEVSKSL